MLKGIIAEINNVEATIVLSNNTTYVIPVEFLPKCIEQFNFVTIENGIVKLDENTDDYLELMSKLAESVLKNK